MQIRILTGVQNNALPAEKLSYFAKKCTFEA